MAYVVTPTEVLHGQQEENCQVSRILSGECDHSILSPSLLGETWGRGVGGVVSQACPSLPGSPPLVDEHSSFLPAE